LTGIWRGVGIGLWAIVSLLSLVILLITVFYMDAWFSTPADQLAAFAPTTEPAFIEETIRPFQQAIFDLGLTLPGYAHYFTFLRLLAGLPYFFIAWLIVRRRSDRLMAVAFAAALGLIGAAGTVYNPLWAWFPESFPWHPDMYAAWNSLFSLDTPSQALAFYTQARSGLAFLTNFLSALLYSSLLIFYAFPDGRFVPRWTRWLIVLLIPYAILVNFFPASPLNPWNWPVASIIPALPNIIFLGCAGVALTYRYFRAADAVQKQQLKWFVAGVMAMTLSWLVDYGVWEIYPALTQGEYLIQVGLSAVLWELFQDTLWYIGQLFFAICVAVSVFRYRLWEIDLVLNRVLVYGSLTALVLLVYLAAVSVLGTLLRGVAEQAAFFLATGLVAILFEPLRRVLQRGVNRLMYGERDDPYDVLARLSGILAATPGPEESLPALAVQISRALKVPSVAICLEQDGAERLAAFHGSPSDELLRFPLVYQETTVGSLQLARRAPGEEFSRTDLKLIETIARQVSAAAQAVRLHQQLLRSRAQIVAEREEERLRIRRDLHDELGPILASHSLKLAALRPLMRQAPEKAEQMADELIAQSQQTVVEIRRLVHGLRPPVLDQLGLVEAVRDLFRQSDGEQPGSAGLTFAISASPECLPELPAAVEVSAYRIALEAVNNTVRHAQAQHCQVRFTLQEAGATPLEPAVLVVQVCDDGVGLPAPLRAGVGLRSMRERAEEIGGRLAAQNIQPHGTQITAWLPLSV
jgi:signal transduction histidine kinase